MLHHWHASQTKPGVTRVSFHRSCLESPGMAAGRLAAHEGDMHGGEWGVVSEALQVFRGGDGVDRIAPNLFNPGFCSPYGVGPSTNPPTSCLQTSPNGKVKGTFPSFVFVIYCISVTAACEQPTVGVTKRGASFRLRYCWEAEPSPASVSSLRICGCIRNLEPGEGTGLPRKCSRSATLDPRLSSLVFMLCSF
jgi:hypothetical protein